ncbi:MAG: STIV orfB116 family protein [bacterium]
MKLNKTERKYFCNAFSVNMLQTFPAEVIIKEIDINATKNLIESGQYESTIGHKSTADLLSNVLGILIKPNRTTLVLSKYDEVLLAQYYGPRLPEAVTELPEDSNIRWFIVNII